MKIASLFDRIDNLAIVRSTFGKIAPIELAYRGMDSSDTKPILDDIYKIKTFRPEAFFYWNEIYNLLKTE